MGERRMRPSPAIVVAALALVAAVAGTAIAGTDATTSAINKKKVKKIATKQANKAIDGVLPIGSENIADRAVSNAKIGAGAVNRPQIANGAVNGAKLACPAGMQRTSDLCFEQNLRAAKTWTNANADCADQRLRLPSVSEGFLIGRALPVAARDYWTDEWHTTSDLIAITENMAGSVAPLDRNAANPLQYSCVTTVGG
jgi:hypothetical protein